MAYAAGRRVLCGDADAEPDSAGRDAPLPSCELSHKQFAHKKTIYAKLDSEASMGYTIRNGFFAEVKR